MKTSQAQEREHISAWSQLISTLSRLLRPRDSTDVELFCLMANLTVQSTLLARFEFPPYVVTSINERHIIVTGGGGSSKTGVGNRLEIYSLGPGERQTRCVSKIETGDEALMNGINFNHDKKCYFIGGGMKGTCTIFQITQQLDSPDDERDQPQAQNSTHVYSNGFKNSDSNVRFRGKSNGHNTVENSNKSTGSAGEVSGSVTFELKPLKSFQCDFHPKGDNESFLKCVKYVSSRSLIVTGGSDGHIRTWSFPSLRKMLDIQGSSDEIFDMDVSADGKLLGMVTRDGLSQLIDLITGATLDRIQFDPPSKSPVKYKFKFFRFHPCQQSSSTFFTVYVPVVLKTPAPSYIIRWNASSKCVETSCSLRIPNVSCLSISQSGSCLALGSASGSVVVLDTLSLSNLYTIREAHGNIVTRIEFLPNSSETQALSGGYQESVISISIDNKAVWHSFTPQSKSMHLECRPLFTFFNHSPCSIPSTDVFALLSSKFAFIFFLFIVYLISVFISYITRDE